MTTTQLIRARRFLPLFVTQLLGAFNDNLYKTAMVLFVVYGVFSDPESETLFSAVATCCSASSPAWCPSSSLKCLK